MAASKSRSRQRRPKTVRRTMPPRPRAAEALLLDLSRAVTSRAASVVGADDLRALIDMLVAAFRADAPLAAALRKDWLRTRGDKAAHLAIGWAREQIRVALAEALQRAREAGVARPDVDADVLAWLCLAACEAVAHEPLTAVGDRADSLAAFLIRA